MMRNFLTRLDDFLSTRRLLADETTVKRSLGFAAVVVVIGGAFYGLVMGAFGGLDAGRWAMMAVSALKVPVLLAGTFAICLPPMFVLSSIAGLRGDWPRLFGALVTSQAAMTLVLAALAPIMLVLTMSNLGYEGAVVLHALTFLVALWGGGAVARRALGDLASADRPHRGMLRLWLVLYAFVAIQLAWVMRPFVGDPNAPVAIFRPGAWGNAYGVLLHLLGKGLWGLLNL